MAVVRKGDGTVVADEVEFARTLPQQALGLMFRKGIPPGYAMIFEVRREQYIGIHMMFVPFPIDLLYLDQGRRIVGIKRRLRPWIGLAYPKRPARYAIEMPAGTAERFGLKEGERLEW